MCVLAGALALSMGCKSDITYAVATDPAPRLNSRPNPYTFPSLEAGMHRVSAGSTKVIVYVPSRALGRKTVPLNLLLHGSGRDAEQLVEAHREFADKNGVVILAPYASISTWDAIYTTFGPDVQGIDRALAWVFDRLPVNPSRIAVTGFSDGATYSLALGRANGDLFSKVVGYSPGFVIDVQTVGHPEIDISHGTHDEELSYATTRDQIVPSLRSKGYSVEFHPFDGPHTVLLGLVEETLTELAAALD